MRAHCQAFSSELRCLTLTQGFCNSWGVEHYARTPDVGSRALVRCISSHLWCLVVHRAAEIRHSCGLSPRAGKAKVRDDQFTLPRASKEQVFTLEVTVHNSMRVDVLKAAEELRK